MSNSGEETVISRKNGRVPAEAPKGFALKMDDLNNNWYVAVPPQQNKAVQVEAVFAILLATITWLEESISIIEELRRRPAFKDPE